MLPKCFIHQIMVWGTIVIEHSDDEQQGKGFPSNNILVHEMMIGSESKSLIFKFPSTISSGQTKGGSSVRYHTLQTKHCLA